MKLDARAVSLKPNTLPPTGNLPERDRLRSPTDHREELKR